MTTETPTTTLESTIQEILDDTHQCDCRATDCPHERDANEQCMANAKYRLVGSVLNASRPGGILLCEPCFLFLCQALDIDFDYLLATGHRRPAGQKKDAG